MVVNTMSLNASIVIPTLNREAILCDTLDSIVSVADGSGLIEIIVVDQSPSHQSETLCRLEMLSKHPQVKYYQVTFRGTTRARNLGASLARGDVVIYVDDDVFTPPGFVQAHLDQYLNSTIAGVAGCVIHENERKLGECDLDPSTVSRVRSGKQVLFNAGFHYDAKWARGCNMSFRREWILKVGGFDENFYGIAVGEEPEFCHRLREAGGRIHFAPETELFHRLEASGGSRDQLNLRERFLAYVDNSVYFWCCTETHAFKRFWQIARLLRSSLTKSNVVFSGRFMDHLRWSMDGLLQGLERFSARKPNSFVLGAAEVDAKLASVLREDIYNSTD
ncbi:MAG TPA: hypothetical protein DDZ88_18675 [Verrucomicrobiales bacterium]|nr:hypothetical protein [Verrucomicrobiales bacterium]